MKKIIHSFLLSVTIIQSSPMILNHGPVVITFDLDKCRKSNNCDAVYSTNNLNPTQLTIANIEFNAKNNKIGKIKINSTQWNTGDKEVNKNRIDTTNTQKNKNSTVRTGVQRNPTTISNDLQFNNTNNDFTAKRGFFLNNTHELSTGRGYLSTKRNNSRKLTDNIENMVNDTVSSNKNETLKTINFERSLEDKSDNAYIRTSSFNLKSMPNEIHFNLINNNEHVINKINNNITKSFKVTSVTKNRTDKVEKTEQIRNTSKSNVNDQNYFNTTELKTKANISMLELPENKTINLLPQKHNQKSDSRNITNNTTKFKPKVKVPELPKNKTVILLVKQPNYDMMSGDNPTELKTKNTVKVSELSINKTVALQTTEYNHELVQNIINNVANLKTKNKVKVPESLKNNSVSVNAKTHNKEPDIKTIINNASKLKTKVNNSELTKNKLVTLPPKNHNTNNESDRQNITNNTLEWKTKVQVHELPKNKSQVKQTKIQNHEPNMQHITNNTTELKTEVKVPDLLKNKTVVEQAKKHHYEPEMRNKTTALKNKLKNYVYESLKNKAVVPEKKYNNESDAQNITYSKSKPNLNVSHIKNINQPHYLQVIQIHDSNTKLRGNIKKNQSIKDISGNRYQNKVYNITKLNAINTKHNKSIKQSTEGKNGNHSKVIWNLLSELIKENNKTNHTYHLLNTIGLFNITNDKHHDNDVKTQTDGFELDIDNNEPTTEFSAVEYYKNLNNKTMKIRKTALDNFDEMDKVSRSKRTHEFEVSRSRLAHAKETTEGSEGNPSYQHPKLVFNDIYSNMFKPTMLFRHKKDGHLSNLQLNLADLEVQTQSAPLSSSTSLAISAVSTVPFQYAGTIFLINDKFSTPYVSSTTKATTTLKPKREEKGLLDLIFPASRVQTFKNLFNAIRRILSHTF